MTPLFAWLIPGALAAEVAGVVLSSEGLPLAQATVAAYDQRLEYTATTTDADGSFILDDLDAGTWRLWAIPHYTDNNVARFHPDARDFCASTRFVLQDDDLISDADFALPTGATLVGALRDSGGDPIEGAVVVAEPGDGAGYIVSRGALTDSSGAFEVLGLDAPVAADLAWTCAVEAEGWPEQYLGSTYDLEEAGTFAVGAETTVDVGTHALLDGILVEGTVQGPDGPAADATVHVYSNSQIVTVSTDEDGRYEGIGLPPGQVLPWVSTDGLAMTYYPDADRPTDFIPAEDEGDIVEGADLHPPAQAIFQARFTDAADGGSIGDVTALLYNDTSTVGRGDSAGSDGLLQVDRLHGGDYTLYVWAAAAGYADDWVRDTDGTERVFSVQAEVANAVLEIPLPRAGALGGTVHDDEGNPVHGAAVTVLRADGQWDRATSERDGTWRIDGLPAGDWLISAEYQTYCEGDRGYVTAWWPDQVNPDWRAPVTLAEGEWVDAVYLVVPIDEDHDAMADAWESGWGLDTGRDDSAEDPDDDGYSNLEEFLLDTDPTRAAATAPTRGCGASAAALLLPLLAIGRRR